MVFHMKQQMGSGKIQPRATFGAGNVVFTIAAMVHAPHREETDQTTAHQHRSHMVNQQGLLADGCEQQHGKNQGQIDVSAVFEAIWCVSKAILLDFVVKHPAQNNGRPC